MEHNIEQYFFIAVKMLITIYLFRRLWLYTMDTEHKIWKYFNPKNKPQKKVAVADIDREKTIDKDFSVVGKTHKVNINEMYEKQTGETSEEEPEDELEEDSEDETEPEIVDSVPLEYNEPEQEPEITEDDIEVNLNPPPLDEADTFTPFARDDELGDSEFFTGITVDQFTGAVKVLKNMEAAEEEEKEEAAKVLYQVQNTDMFEFVATQVSNVATLDKLFNTYFDGNGLPKPRPRKESLIIDGFDINAFI